MKTRITSFTAHQTAEGMRVTYTYSVIDADGNLIKSNQRATLVVMETDVEQKITDINAWLLTKVPK